MTASIAETNTELYEKVRDCVAEALALDLDEISPESTLLDELELGLQGYAYLEDE